MPAAEALSHPPPSRQNWPPHTWNEMVALTEEIPEWPWIVFQMYPWRNLLKAACPFHSRAITEETHHQILNCRHDEQWNRWVLCKDCHWQPSHRLNISFSWWWLEVEQQEMCDTFVSCFKMAVSDKYKKIIDVTKRNTNACTVTEFKHCVQER